MFVALLLYSKCAFCAQLVPAISKTISCACGTTFKMTTITIGLLETVLHLRQRPDQSKTQRSTPRTVGSTANLIILYDINYTNRTN